MRADHLDQKNPFDPNVERVPLTLVLDARSIGALEGKLRKRAHFLCELCWTKAIDGLWSWEGAPIDDHIPRTELRPVEYNSRTVGRLDEPPGCFIGGVRAWDQFDRWADQQGYEGRERDWFIYYGSLAHFSDRSGRHYLVTADQRLLKETEGDKGWFRRGQHRIISVGHALFLVGLAMKAHREVFYESPQPGHTVYTFSHSMYEWLAMDFVQPRRRLFDLVKAPDEELQDYFHTEREALVESIFDRVSHILRSRDRIALSNARNQDDGTLNDMRYDLSAMIGNIAGVFDSLAVLAHTVLVVPLKSNSDSEITLRRYPFRRGLKEVGAERLATVAGQIKPLLDFIWGLRNPLFHRHGLPGQLVHVLGSGKKSQITLSTEQADLFKKMLRHRKESTTAWGLDDPEAKGIDPSVAPFPFGHHLAIASISAVDELLDAFAKDRGVEGSGVLWSAEQKQMLTRFRWLSGLPDELPARSQP